ncbi:MAG: winged helix-turn-helix transcriptional regulator [Candidatus Heimdallarchaeota archaeon]|nr:winged helix-turn-helix transcriptional regulator [Candidatus Heimdallarchaeota archaeon]
MVETNSSLDEILKGKTFQIYWYLLLTGKSGVREIQKQLKIPSSSTVHYHLNKLLQAGLVNQDSLDKYFVEEPVKAGILGLYIKIGRRMIPRMIFYLSFFLVCGILYISYLILNASVIKFVDGLFLVLSFSGMLFFSYETYKIWKMKPL